MAVAENGIFEVSKNKYSKCYRFHMPLNLRGEKTVRAEKTEKFIHKLKCKFGKMPVEKIDERLTTVQAHKTMNFLDVNKKNKKNIVDTIAAVYILETYMRKEEKK